MSFRDSSDLSEQTKTNKQEREPVRNVPERGVFKEIESGAGGKTFKMDRRGIWLGDQFIETAPFSVDMNGVMKIQATIGQNKFIGIDPNKGLWLGAENFEDAPFSVDIEGNMKLKATAQTSDMSMEWYNEDDKLSIYLGFKDV